MKIRNILTIVTAVGSLILAPATLAEDAAEASDKTVVEIAAGNEAFGTLVAAVKAADLAEALSGEGPFTIFAPNDAAFAKLPDGTLGTLLKPENKEKLQAILKLHVVSGKVMAADVKSGKVPTLNGESIDVEASADGVTVNGAKVIKTDIAGSNGVIHVIDTVILPKS